MMLGVVLHTCAAFSVSKYWVISYPQPLVWADTINSTIHMFRMPAFFIIAGFFSILLLEKQSVTKFVANKFYRIGVPFLAALILFNLPQQFLLIELDGYLRFSINLPSVTGHLWFLINLLVYFCIISFIYPIINFGFRRIKNNITNTLLLLVILGVPIIHVLLLSLTRFSIPIYESFPIIGSLYGVMLQFDYFILGAFFYWLLSTKLDNVLTQKRWILTALVLVGVKFVMAAFSNLDADATLGMVLTVFIERWQVIGLCMLLLTASKCLLNNTNKSIQKIFDASYSVYLIHHLVVVLLTLLSIELFSDALDANILFFIILIATFFISFGFHQLVVKKYRFAHRLFNGK